MDSKEIRPILIIGIVAIIVSLGFGVYLLFSKGGHGAWGTSVEETVSGEAGSEVSTGEEIGTGGISEKLLSATSLSFIVSGADYEGKKGTFSFKMKNIGQPNFKLSVDFITEDGEEEKIIADKGLNRIWKLDPETGWEELPSITIPYFEAMALNFQSQLRYWDGRDPYIFTNPDTGQTITISNILVNPDLPDSLFQPI